MEYSREEYAQDMANVEELRVRARSAVAEERLGGFEYLHFLRWLDGLEKDIKTKYRDANAKFWARRRKRGTNNNRSGLDVARTLLAAAWREIDKTQMEALQARGDIVRTSWDPVRKITRYWARVDLRETW